MASSAVAEAMGGQASSAFAVDIIHPAWLSFGR